MMLSTVEPLLDYRHRPILLSHGQKCPTCGHDVTEEPMLFRDAAHVALHAPLPPEQGDGPGGQPKPPRQPTPEENLRAFKLTKALFDDVEADLPIGDWQFIKERCGLTCGPLLFGRMSEIIDNGIASASITGEHA